MSCIWDAYKRERVRNGLASSADLFGLFAREEDIKKNCLRGKLVTSRKEFPPLQKLTEKIQIYFFFTSLSPREIEKRVRLSVARKNNMK